MRRMLARMQESIVVHICPYCQHTEDTREGIINHLTYDHTNEEVWDSGFCCSSCGSSQTWKGKYNAENIVKCKNCGFIRTVKV